MAFNQTEQYAIHLRGDWTGTLALVPATESRPWRLLRGNETLATLSLPADVPGEALYLALQTSLAAQGLEIAGCGACSQWTPPLPDPTATPDAGHCGWSDAENAPHLPALTAQHALAAPCLHFSPSTGQVAAPVDVPAASEPAARARRPWWRAWGNTASQASQPAERMVAQMAERSGKRPGTIPCLACPGRMANLGAQKCRTPAGDDRTFSVWRCRRCLGYYVNDWTDKWVRTDTLEVVDVYYRVAPADAATCLVRIERTVAHEIQADALQQWFDAYLLDQTPVRHEVRHAR